MEIRTVGIDLGKSVFHLVGLDERGSVVAKKRFSRSQLLTYTANLSSCLIGMEACCGAHFLGAKLLRPGHQVRLIPAQFVKPFVKSNKNDYIDAEAIAEAVRRPTMRFVPIKSDEQLDLQALHRVRDRLISRRTGVINQLRALLLERGTIFHKGRRYLLRQLPLIMEDAEQNLYSRMRRLLEQLWQEWKSLEEEIQRSSDEIESIARQDDACQRLLAVLSKHSKKGAAHEKCHRPFSPGPSMSILRLF